MSKWEKEDRSIYENSEVMMEFEKLILSRCVQLKDIYKKAQETKIEKATDEAEKLNKTLKEVETTAKNVFSADDGEAEESNDIEDVESEDITISAKEEVVAEVKTKANELSQKISSLEDNLNSFK